MLQTLHPSRILSPAPPTPSCARHGFVLGAGSAMSHGAATLLPCAHLCGNDRSRSRAPELVPGEHIAALCPCWAEVGRSVRFMCCDSALACLSIVRCQLPRQRDATHPGIARARFSKLAGWGGRPLPSFPRKLVIRAGTQREMR